MSTSAERQIPERQVRVVIADDHPVVRRGIRNILEGEEGIEVVGEAATGEEALRLVQSEEPDVLLLDVEMPDVSGVEVARELQRRGDRVHVLALSSYDDQEYVIGLLESGANGYLTKEKAPFLIAEAVRAVARGEVRWFVRPERADSVAQELTEREKEVLRLLAEGRSNQEIAGELSRLEHTVRSHMTRLYQKLGVKSAREAIAWAWQRGLMSRR